MKRIVSISIGSSERDHQGELKVGNETYLIERLGTDGSLLKAAELIESLDGQIEAFGMGGIDLYLWAGKKRYTIREAYQLKKAAKQSPIVDGSGLKNTLERRVINYLQQEKIIDFSNKRVLFTSAMDRYGMADTLRKCGANLVIGDLMFGLGIDTPLYSLKQLDLISRILAPIICKLPFKWLYPTGDKQNSCQNNRLQKYYEEAEIIAGDYHFIKRYMPPTMKGKIIITNTITRNDILELKSREVELVVTTTPDLQGRSFGTNVIEALFAAILKERDEVISPANYDKIIDELKLAPRIIYLKREGIAKDS